MTSKLKRVEEKEIKSLSQEEAKRIMRVMDEEMQILFAEVEAYNSGEEPEKKLPYKESFDDHWENQIRIQLFYFYKLGKHNGELSKK